ncbi:SPOR domain-containing protein [candidate division KSB1 bacterium]|nr:SPOR domain-containing protein [candidate division KSB1 bacterium]
MKQALGLAVSGTEVRLAHLVNDKGQMRIESLERAKLKTTLEYQLQASDNANEPLTDAKDAFGVKDSQKDSQKERETGEIGYKQDSANVEVLYKLLEKHARKKVKIAFNIPLSLTSYERLDGPFADTAPGMAERFAGMDRETGPSYGHQVLQSGDGSGLSLSFERNPPTLSLLREINNFLHGKLYLGLMDTSEIALANLARSSMNLEPGKITAIIYLEDEFTRLIFLHGQDLFHVSSIIHEEASAANILEVIYRKFLYEQDEAHIPETSTILLAGKSNRLNARDFFAERFRKVTVSYLAAELLDSFPAKGTQHATFAEFAVPIALAWKLLEPQKPSFIPLNLLPQELLDQQKVLKLSYHGYALLALTGLAAFFFTWQILRTRSHINTARSQNAQVELKIKTNQVTVDRVLALEEELKRLRKNTALSDSLSQKHDEFLVFLQKLNASVERTGSLWVDEILKSTDGFAIKGTSLNREKIPVVAEKLEQAGLRKVTRSEAGSQKLFQFELERYNNPSSFVFSETGIRIIDVNKYSSGGSLILKKDGSQELPAPPVTGSTTAPAAAAPAAPLRQPPPALARATNDEKTGTRQSAGSLGAARQAAFTPPAKERPQAAGSSEPAPVKRGRQERSQPDRPKVQPSFAVATAEGIAERNGGQFTPAQAATTDQVQKTAVSTPTAVQPKSQSLNGASETAPPNSAARGAAGQRETETRALTASPNVAQPEIFRGYAIEAASTSTRELAEQYLAAYRKQGHDALVEKYYDASKGMERYRVLVGNFPSRSAAENKAEQIGGPLMQDYRIVGLK